MLKLILLFSIGMSLAACSAGIGPGGVSVGVDPIPGAYIADTGWPRPFWWHHHHFHGGGGGGPHPGPHGGGGHGPAPAPVHPPHK
jgi:hypothetical protein